MKISIKSIDKAKEGELFHGIFYCLFKENAITKYGDQFIKLTLRDSTGAIDGKLWENCSYFDQKFEEGDIVAVKALPSIYRNKIILNIQSIDKYAALRHDAYGFKDNLIPNSKCDSKLLWKELGRYLRKTGQYSTFIRSIYKKHKDKILEYPYSPHPELQKEGGYIENLFKALEVCSSLLKESDRSDKYDLSLVYTLVFLKKLSIIACYNKEGVYKIKEEASLKGEKSIFCNFINEHRSSAEKEDYFLIQKHINCESSIQKSFEFGLVKRVFEIIDYAAV